MTLDMSHPLLLDEPPQNGHLDAGDVPPLVIRQVARRVRWLSLNDDETYPGFEIKVWLNPSHAQRRLMDVAEGDRVTAFIKLIVLEHNGWADEDGEAFPPASEPAFWDAIPTELGIRIVGAINEALTQLPNSISAAKRS